MRKGKTEEYLEIKDGYPPPKIKTRYSDKLPDGELSDIAKRIKVGQYVENLSTGSTGKLATFIKAEGLRVVCRAGQGDERGKLYVVSEEWLSTNPD